MTNSLTLRELPIDERPRERMLKYGVHAISNAELLAILLRTGTVSESAVTLAQRVLQASGGLRPLVGMSLEQLMETKGIGTAKALQIKAGIEIGRRIAKDGQDNKFIVRTPEDVSRYLMEDMRYLTKEYFKCLFLNTKNHVIGCETLSIGSLNASIVHPREVFRAAVSRSAASIICVHNHPSGDPTPSREDIRVTERLKEAGEIIGVELLDHVILGDSKFISLKEQGLL